MQPASRFSTRDRRPHRSHLYKERKGGPASRARLGGMNTSPPLAPVRFLIEIISPEPQPFERENFKIRIQLNNGHWTQPYVAQGIHDLRGTLMGRGADEVKVNHAIDELQRYRKTEIDLR
jgi:hypothetical protein